VVLRWCGAAVLATEYIGGVGWWLQGFLSGSCIPLGWDGQGHPQPLAYISLRWMKVRVTRCLLLALLAGPGLYVAQPDRFRRRGTPLVRGL
jgi:hypothetical protein